MWYEQKREWDEEYAAGCASKEVRLKLTALNAIEMVSKPQMITSKGIENFNTLTKN